MLLMSIFLKLYVINFNILKLYKRCNIICFRLVIYVFFFLYNIYLLLGAEDYRMYKTGQHLKN